MLAGPRLATATGPTPGATGMSASLHVAMVALMYFGLPLFNSPDQEYAIIPIDLEYEQVTDETTALPEPEELTVEETPLEDPAALPEPEPLTAEAPRQEATPPPPPEFARQPRIERVALIRDVAEVSPPPPPVAAVRPPRPEAATVAPPVLEAATEVVAEATEPEPEPELVAAIEPEPVPPPVPIARPSIPRPPPAVKEVPKKTFDANRLAALLDKKVKEKQRQTPTKRVQEPAPQPAPVATRVARPARLTISERDLIRKHIMDHWIPNMGAQGVELMMVRVRITLNPDGTLSRQPVIVGKDAAGQPERVFLPFAESALRAVLKSVPLPVPLDKYEQWREIEFTFSLKDMLG